MVTRVLIGIAIAFITCGAGRAAGNPPLDDRRADFRAALEQAERGPTARFDRVRAALADHPLNIWLDYAVLRGQLDDASRDRIEPFLRRHAGEPAAELLRPAWLGTMAKRQDWPGFLAAYTGSDRLELRCRHALARLRTGPLDEAWFADVQALWLHGQSLPDACDLPFAEFAARGRLTPALRWQRIELAARSHRAGLMRFLARSMAPADQALAERYAAFVESPHSDLTGWPVDGRSRAIAGSGLSSLARRDPDAADRLLPAIESALAMGPADIGPLRHQIALWSAASTLPEAGPRLAAVPADHHDQGLYRWRLREALARGDDRAALAAIERLPADQRTGGGRWDYFEARLRERLGQPDQANRLYARAAREADFHGFLAADRIDRPYALCPKQASTDPALRQRMGQRPGLVRALELFRLDRLDWAEREWRHLLATLDQAERIEAVRQARAAGWHDRALTGLGVEPEELRYYRLRFPLPFNTLIREQARRNDLDPAWLAAQIRAESAWMRNARSPADARGLMQLRPGTARDTARALGLPWRGSQALNQPSLNITLGSAYLRAMLDRFEGRTHLAIAAYNAGPNPVRRWRQERPDLDTDFFIETIPFHETRDYVARVLAFSVIYDWRLHGRAVTLSDRLASATVGRPSRAIVCPDPAIVATP